MSDYKEKIIEYGVKGYITLLLGSCGLYIPALLFNVNQQWLDIIKNIAGRIIGFGIIIGIIIGIISIWKE